MMISTVITKPTKVCNASCTYCAAPPDGAPRWTLDDVRVFFDRLAPGLTDEAVIIWHGGEPMLMGPDFYYRAYEIATAVKPNIRFSMQSNLLGYTSKRWAKLFSEVFGGSISTSFDPDQKYREYRGSTKLYTRLFFDRLGAVLDDGFRPTVIGTYTEETSALAEHMYETSMAYGDRAFPLRFNYRYPAGRAAGEGCSITPETYGAMLIRLYDRWIREVPGFTITPLDEMLLKVAGQEQGRCPWTRACGGRFLGVEPNLDAYNCSEFADMEDPAFAFGNLNRHGWRELLASRAAAQIRRRRVELPIDCLSCRHFDECEGGCARDSVLYDRGLYGKFFYCHSWMAVFDRIKQSILTGEADQALRMFRLDPDAVRSHVRERRTEPVAA